MRYLGYDELLDNAREYAPKASPSVAKRKNFIYKHSSEEDIIKAEQAKDDFKEIWEEEIIFKSRVGGKEMMHYLEEESDFFVAPASTKYHGAVIGGLVEHSLHVYMCLKDLLSSKFYSGIGIDVPSDTIAVCGLLHDICKVNFYVPEVKNRKNKNGSWESYLGFTIDDAFPFGHGEKSVYAINKFMKLRHDEAMAIRYHMGFSNCEGTLQRSNYSKSASLFPLILALSEADTRAALILER